MIVWTCTKCGIEKPLTVEFFSERSNSRGFESRCRDCVRAYKYENAQKHKAERRRRVNERNRQKREAREAERAAQPPPTHRVCVKCGQEKPLTAEWFAIRSGTSRLDTRCRECVRKYIRQYTKIHESERKRKAAEQKAERKRERAARRAAEPLPISQVCNTCHTEKPLSYEFFPRDKKRRCGLATRCWDCQRQRSHNYYEANKARHLERTTEYNKAHAAELRSYHAAYYLKNKDALSAQNRRRYEANREYWLQYHRSFYAANKERYAQQARAWRLANKDKKREAERRREARKRNLTIVGFDPSLLDQKWDYWGGKCWICGAQADSWDHVKPLAKNGYHCLANLRPACRSCNGRKQDKWPLTPEIMQYLTAAAA